MNIRVDLNTPINDGTEVVFRSPVDCSQITGLVLYYPGTDGNTSSKEFAFADAHGNNVGDIDHLFAENVVVKVILDVTTSMAFVQNADTNAYLEGRFDDIINKLAPSLTEKGEVVTCEPVEGYPLKVTTELPETEKGITLFHSGKNLFDYEQYPFESSYYDWNNGQKVKSNSYSCIEKLMPVGHLKGKTITVNHTTGDLGNWPSGGLCFYTGENTFIREAGGNGYTYVVPENAEYMGFTVTREYADGTKIQIEIGNAKTDYEPYQGQEIYSAKPTDKSHDWGRIPAKAGTNVLFSSVGTTVVEGKADPVAIIDKLTNAIISLGGNV